LAMFIVKWRDPATGTPAIDLERAKTMTSREIIDAFRATHHIDHWPVMRAWGGEDHPTNYQPLPTRGHIEKTKIDIRNNAKAKRLAADRAAYEEKRNKVHEDFRRKVLAPDTDSLHERTDQQPTKKRSRPFPKSSRKIPSRPFPKRNKEKRP
jgi:hypothetical protein